MHHAPGVLKSAVERKTHAVGAIWGRCVDGQAMKDKDIAGIHLTTNPSIAGDRIGWDLRDMEVVSLMFLDAEAMGAFLYHQGALARWAVVKRNPNSVELRVSLHEFVVLMRVDYQSIAVRKY